MATWRIHDRKPGPETWSCHVSALHVLRLDLPHSFGDRSARIRFVLRRPPTFAFTRYAVPDVESHFSRQAKVAHGRSQQHVAARALSFCSERFPLLFNERAHFAVRGAACGCQRPRSRLRSRGRLGPASLAIVGAHRQVRPERMPIEVEGPIAETHFPSIVAKAKTSWPKDQSRRLLAHLRPKRATRRACQACSSSSGAAERDTGGSSRPDTRLIPVMRPSLAAVRTPSARNT